MKTRIYTLLSVAALPFVLFSCIKEKQFEMPAPGNLVEIHASIIDSDATKVVAVDAENGIDWNWAEGDQIAVASGAASSIFSIRNGFAPKEASFIGKEIKGEQFAITYPAISADEMGALNLSGQTQTGNGDKSHLQYFALLENLADYTEFAFDPEAEHFKQCGVLHFSLVLPDEATKVDRVILRAGSAVFHTGNAADALSEELSLGIKDGAVGADHAFEAWMTTSWFEDEIPAGTKLEVNVIAGDFNWVADITPTVNKAIKPGKVNNAKVDDASKWATGSRYADGEGTKENPWQIKTAKQLMCVHEDLVEGEITYYKLIADIDLSGEEWVPLNNKDPYKKYIDFDGQGYTISNLTITEPVGYASFAGVLYGSLRNVTFNGASINAGGNKSGVVCGYMGTAAALIPAEAVNVTVKNSSVTATTSCGGFVGQTGSDNALFDNCHVINTVVLHTGTGNYHTGGFVGRAQKAAAYKDCSAQATVSSDQYTGGFAGYIEKGTYERCFSTSTVNGVADVGGFVGKADAGTLKDCYYAGPSVNSSVENNPARLGGFIGYANTAGSSFTNCYVKGAALVAAKGYRVGGFAGQAANGNSFTKCYVQDVTIDAGLYSAGFVGVDYSMAINQCYVDGGTLNPSGEGKTDDGVGVAGFVAYPEGAVIKNCFTTMAITGDWDGIGGFFAFAKANTTIQYCYADCAIASGGDPVGIFGAWVPDLAGIVINSCIGWSDTLPFIAWEDGGTVSDNYCGKTGTISSQAAAMGWDPSIWNFNATLR